MLSVNVGEFSIPLNHQINEEKDLAKIQLAYKHCFTNPSGAIVLSDLLRRSHFMQTTHVSEDPGGRDSAFNEGQQYLVNCILNFLARDPRELERIMTKQKTEEES